MMVAYDGDLEIPVTQNCQQTCSNQTLNIPVSSGNSTFLPYNVNLSVTTLPENKANKLLRILHKYQLANEVTHPDIAVLPLILMPYIAQTAHVSLEAMKDKFFSYNCAHTFETRKGRIPHQNIKIIVKALTDFKNAVDASLGESSMLLKKYLKNLPSIFLFEIFLRICVRHYKTMIFAFIKSGSMAMYMFYHKNDNAMQKNLPLCIDMALKDAYETDLEPAVTNQKSFEFEDMSRIRGLLLDEDVMNTCNIFYFFGQFIVDSVPYKIVDNITNYSDETLTKLNTPRKVPNDSNKNIFTAT